MTGYRRFDFIISLCLLVLVLVERCEMTLRFLRVLGALLPRLIIFCVCVLNIDFQAGPRGFNCWAFPDFPLSIFDIPIWSSFIGRYSAIVRWPGSNPLNGGGGGRKVV